MDEVENPEFPILEPFYVTFGSQYPREEHPTWSGANKDGYFVIHAPDELSARKLAFGLFGEKWSMIYTAAEFDPNSDENKRWYTLGRIGYAATTARLH